MAIKFAPLTGSTPTAITVPDQHVGSNDASELYRRLSSDVVLSRGGIAVSVRKWAEVNKWRFNYSLISEGDMANLRTFFVERTFYLQPYGTAFVQYAVRWVETEFNPTQIKPGYYSLEFTLEEVLN